jgi:hypothetical protein
VNQMAFEDTTQLTEAVELVESYGNESHQGFLRRSQVRLHVDTSLQEMALINLLGHGLPRFQFDHLGFARADVLAVNAVLLAVRYPIAAILWWFKPCDFLPDSALPIDLIDKKQTRLLISAAAESLKSFK